MITIPDLGAVSPLCILFFPGSRPELYEKAMASGADQVCMDLEDAVALDAKDGARSAAAELLASPDMDATRFILRINHPSTPEGDLDLTAIGERGALPGRPLTLMIPKVDAPDDLRDVRARLQAHGLSASLVPVIETVRGLARVEELAVADSVSGLLFGGLDLSVDLGAAMEWEPLLYARSRVVHAARLGGIGATDMPFLQLNEPTGLRAEAERAHKLGFNGKAVIHPDHVDVVVDVFSPTAEEVSRARRVTETFDREPAGVLVVDGVMIDRPGIESARRIVSWADARGR